MYEGKLNRKNPNTMLKISVRVENVNDKYNFFTEMTSKQHLRVALLNRCHC